MKFLDKLALKIFSIIILVVTVVITLIMFGVLSPTIIIDNVIALTDLSVTSYRTIAIVAVIAVLLSIKGLFFTSKPENSGREGIVLENKSGKLVISKESLENLIASVVKEIPGADSVSSKTILDKNKNLIVYVTATVSKDVMIKDVSNDLQEKVKEAMKRTADLDVKEVNIKIKNITSKRVKTLPSAIVNVEKEDNTSSNDNNEETNEENS